VIPGRLYAALVAMFAANVGLGSLRLFVGLGTPITLFLLLVNACVLGWLWRNIDWGRPR
jgi:hypothetical protein